ncbi:MAG: type II toxin-antitoxin system VapC family toxin [Elusimicrobiota bacterium]
MSNRELSMKEKIYLDASVPSAYFDSREKKRQRITQKWWKEILFKRYDVYISKIVERELEDTKDETKRTGLLNLVKGIKSFEVTLEGEKLARIYIENDIIPELYYEDAVHLAIATINDIRVLVSWNFMHLVNHETRRKVKAVNLLHGYREIEIESPLELGGGEYE